MDTSKKAQQQYSEMVKKASPNSPIFMDCIKAFVSGGIICTIGQVLLNLYTGNGISKEDAGLWVSITLVGISAVLTALGLYEKLGKFCGAGTIVPITGFANSVVSPAIEFKKDSSVIIGAKTKHCRWICFLALILHFNADRKWLLKEEKHHTEVHIKKHLRMLFVLGKTVNEKEEKL